MKHRDYYEAIIQLRNPSQELLNMIKNQFNKRKDVIIVKKVEFDNGVDLYVSSQRFARALGNKMKRNFKGELKTSRSLYSVDRQTSKRIYRVTVLFRMA